MMSQDMLVLKSGDLEPNIELLSDLLIRGQQTTALKLRIVFTFLSGGGKSQEE